MPHHPPISPPPKPTRIFFDPFNSSSTGHQRAESKIAGSTSWRDSRTYKLANQFGDISGRGGDVHISDQVGAGSVNWGKDGRKENGDWEKGAPGLREKGWQDISTLMSGSRKRKTIDDEDDFGNKRRKREVGGTNTNPVVMNNKRSRYTNPEGERDQDKATATKLTAAPMSTLAISSPSSSSRSTSISIQYSTQPSSTVATIPPSLSSPPSTTNPPRPPQIFTSLTLYLNGPTLPIISDHRLKILWTQHGGTISLSLARRKVTHVILASSSSLPSPLPSPSNPTTSITSTTAPSTSKQTPTPNALKASTSTETAPPATGRGGGGGLLSSTKIQKEISRVRGQGIKYVTAQWVVDCIDRGKRISEMNYVPDGICGRIGGAGQRGVGLVFGQTGIGGK